MSKYDPLNRYLLGLDRNEWRATFADIERVLGFKLPRSARDYPAWWANEAEGSHVHAKAWMAAGWETSDLNLTGETIIFERTRSPSGIIRTGVVRHQSVKKSEERSAHITKQLALSQKPSPQTKRLTPLEFEVLAREVLSEHFQTRLSAGQVAGVPKTFDLVSEDCRIIGDAKYFTLVRGERLPPAKFSVIAEYVWLLERTDASYLFLVFGNDRRVPALWLEKYGRLLRNFKFFFLSDEGQLEVLVVKTLKGGIG